MNLLISSGIIGNLSNIASAEATTKVTEAADKASSLLGGTFGAFTKLSAKSDELNSLPGKVVTGQKVLDAEGRAVEPGSNVLQATDAAIAEANRNLNGQGNLTAAAAKSIEYSEQDDKRHIVKLVDRDLTAVEFKSMPEIQEQRQVQYEAVQPPQSPGAFQKYKQTDSVTWQVNATLISRNSVEATENLRLINILRGWTMPYFGAGTAATFEKRLGAPPPTLSFSGYNQAVIGPVPVVITSLNWTWPKDVDWLPAVSPSISEKYTAGGSGSLLHAADSINAIVENSPDFISPFPAVVQVTISLVESFSTTQFNNFDLNAFRRGDMIAAYLPTITQVTAAEQNEAQVVQPANSALKKQLGTSTPGVTKIDPRTSLDKSFSGKLPEGSGALVSSTKSQANNIKSGNGGNFGGAGSGGDW